MRSLKHTPLRAGTVIAVILLICGPLHGLAQQTASKKGIIQAALGENLTPLLPDDVVYMYPVFQQGTVLYYDNSSSGGLMNIFLIGSDLHFVDAQGDTLVLNNQDNVRLLSIGRDTYMRHNKAYVRILDTDNEVALGIRSLVTLEEAQKIGAYGQVNNTAAISDITVMHQSNQGYYLKSLKNIPYRLRQDVLLYANDRLYVANKNNFSKLFPNRKDDITAYVKEHKTDFDNAQEALDLFHYLTR